MSNRFGVFREEALLIRMLCELGKDKPLMKVGIKLNPSVKPALVGQAEALQVSDPIRTDHRYII